MIRAGSSGTLNPCRLPPPSPTRPGRVRAAFAAWTGLTGPPAPPAGRHPPASQAGTRSGRASRPTTQRQPSRCCRLPRPAHMRIEIRGIEPPTPTREQARPVERPIDALRPRHGPRRRGGLVLAGVVTGLITLSHPRRRRRIITRSTGRTPQYDDGFYATRAEPSRPPRTPSSRPARHRRGRARLALPRRPARHDQRHGDRDRARHLSSGSQKPGGRAYLKHA